MKKGAVIIWIIMFLLVGCKQNAEKDINNSAEELSKDVNETIELGKISVDLDRDQLMDEVQLLYDDSLILKINETEEIIEKTPYGSEIDYQALKKYPQIYTLYYIEEAQCIGIIYRCFTTAKDENVYLEVYRYKHNSINKIWASDVINIEFDKFKFDEEKVSVRFPFVNEVYDIALTKEEVEHSNSVVDELINNGYELDENLLMETKDNVFCNLRELVFEDYNNDGKDELIILADIKTVGAKTPVSLNEDVIFVFSLSVEDIECIDIVVERNKETETVITDYFRSILMSF